MKRQKYGAIYLIGFGMAILNWLNFEKKVGGETLFCVAGIGTLIALVMLVLGEFEYANSKGSDYQNTCLESLWDLLFKPAIIAIFIYSLAMSTTGRFNEMNEYMQKLQMDEAARFATASTIVPIFGFCSVYPVVLPLYIIAIKLKKRRNRAKAT